MGFPCCGWGLRQSDAGGRHNGATVLGWNELVETEDTEMQYNRDNEAADAQIVRNRQCARNREVWKEMAVEAIRADQIDLAIARLQQTKLES